MRSCGPLLSSSSLFKISNGVACLSRLAMVRSYQKIYYFSLSPSFSAADRANGVVTSRQKNAGREGNYLKVSLGSHPLCDKGRSRSADWKSPRTREHASSSSSSSWSISSLHPSLDTARRDIASEHIACRLDKRFCVATPTDLRMAIRKYFILGHCHEKRV